METEKIFSKLSEKIIDGIHQQSIFIEANTSVIDFCNNIAVYAAQIFLENQECYPACDTAMNNINAFMLFNEEILNTAFPEPAFSIYQGFDEGEFQHQNDESSIDPITKYTFPIIKKIIDDIQKVK